MMKHSDQVQSGIITSTDMSNNSSSDVFVYEAIKVVCSGLRRIHSLPALMPSIMLQMLVPSPKIIQNLPYSLVTFKMVKRTAEESLEDVIAHDSPASKKARVEGANELRTKTNGFSVLLAASKQVGGAQRDSSELNANDILATAAQGGEELKEAASSGNEVDELNEQSAYSATARQQAPTEGYSDLYLDTINRSVLDFDFEKLCSVTLSNINVYACLVCGKYYQGRGPKSHAYFHALEVGHHVYINMQTKRVYVLPEGYEVKSKSLDDIKFVVDPRLSKEEVAQLDKEVKDAWDLSGKKYRPGMVIP